MRAEGPSPPGGGSRLTQSTVAPDSAPNCWQCRYFGLSWQPAMPYLCRVMGFKSKVLPCIEVLRADGQHCQGFAPKPLNPAPPS